MKTNVHVSKDELYLETPEAGPVVHLAARTLEGKRLRGDGPTYLKIGKKVLYKYSDLISSLPYSPAFWRLQRLWGRAPRFGFFVILLFP